MTPRQSTRPRGPHLLRKFVVWSWLAAVILVFLAGLGTGIASDWRRNASTSAATPQNTTSYVEHGRTYYVSPTVARWHHRIALTQGVAVAAAVFLTPGVWFVGREWAGRRWQ